MGCAASKAPIAIADVEGAQWCSRAIGCSSQYSYDAWSHGQVAGPPKVYPRYGDLHGAWAPHQSRGTRREWIELDYDRAMRIGSIHVLETFNPGAVVAVMVKSPAGAWEVMWHGAAERGRLPARSRIFSPTLTMPPYAVKSIRLELDTSAPGSWSEIDAVRLLPPSGGQPAEGDAAVWAAYQGTYHPPLASVEGAVQAARAEPPEVAEIAGAQWCSRAITCSSQYNESTWSHRQVAGPPKVYPRYGDLHGAWAPHKASGAREWIELEFERGMQIGGIEIYETFNPGAVVAIKVKSIAGDWEVAWEGAAERGRLPATSRVFSPPLVVPPSPYAVRCVRLELDTRGPGSWSEIDAVRMLPPVEVATPIVVAEVVACLPPEGVTANAGARPLHEVASTLKTALGVDGTILEVIHQSCQQLGVQREGKTLVEAAAQCEAVLHGGRGAAEPSTVVPLL